MTRYKAKQGKSVKMPSVDFTIKISSKKHEAFTIGDESDLFRRKPWATKSKFIGIHDP